MFDVDWNSLHGCLEVVMIYDSAGIASVGEIRLAKATDDCAELASKSVFSMKSLLR